MLKKLLIVVFLFASLITRAQLIPCSTDEHYRELLKKYPQLVDYEEQFNDQLTNKMGARTTAALDTATYDIALVIHIVHDYGSENISDNVIYEAVANWAEIYLKQNSDTISVIPPFIPYMGNSKIRLHLATIDPDGKPTKGVVRHNSYLTVNADDQSKLGQWPQNKYINIWFINTFPGTSTAAAYAYTPSSAAGIPFYDGIISLSTYANYAKVIPHELGHVLNLKHPWGSTNSAGVSCGNDNVDDTPPTKGHTPVGCTPAALYDTVCATGYLKHYMDINGNDSLVNYPDTANSQNIMDYTYCQRMFTKGQCVRMRTALTSSTAGRNNLYAPATLAANGALAPMPDLPPVADFIVNKGSPAGFSDARTYFMAIDNSSFFNFRNASWNDTISGVSWTFSNGAATPSSTSMAVISNKFSVPGWVKVTLVATSNAGSDTLVDPQAVYVADSTPVGGMGYAQEFASTTDISNWPMFNFYKNQFKWQFFTGAGIGDNNCIRYHSFDTSCTTPLSRVSGTAVGDHDDFYTPAFKLTNTPDNLYLDFFTCGAGTLKGISTSDDHISDSLEVEVSVTGGTKWLHLITYKGTDLANNGNLNTDFVPTSTSTWKPRSINIPSAYRSANTYFRMRYWPGNTGNNVYIDRFSISAWRADVREALNSPHSFNIHPNPSSNGCTLTFKTGNEGWVNYTVTDITGKVLSNTTKQYDANSVQQEFISRDITQAAGMYFIIVNIDGNKMVQKFVIY